MVMTEQQKKLADMAAKLALALRGQSTVLDPTTAGLIQGDLEKALMTLRMAQVRTQSPAPVAS
jgi:hypothetical protein